jgi:Tfp pilus assembly protein PilZ
MSKTNNKAVNLYEGALAGGGLEEVTSEDVQIPFLRVLQALSPQIKKSDPAYIKGAEQGGIFNTVTKKFWSGDEGVLVIPVHFQKKLLEFVPRSEGGGFVGEINPKNLPKIVKENGMEMLENGNELVRTAQHYVRVVHEDGTLENAIVDMKKTQIKKSKEWLSIMGTFKYPKEAGPKLVGTTMDSWYNIYRLTTVEESNDKGSWYTWKIVHEKQVDKIEYVNESKSLHTSLSSGELTALPPTDANESEVPF